jgi:hypothetical protein
MSNETALATYEFRRGELAGSHLSLFGACLVHRGADGFETIHLDRISALRVAFERDASRIAWGGALLFIAFLLIAAFLPMRMLVASMAAEVTAQAQGTFLPAAIRALDFCVGLLPFASLGLGAWGITWLALGWIGETVLRVGAGPGDKVFAMRGRDPLLYEFAESVSAQIAKRG